MSVAQMDTRTESGEGGEGAEDPGPSRSSDGAGDRGGGGPTGASIEVIDPGSLLRAGERSWVASRLGEATGVLGVGGEVRVRLTDDRGIAAAHEARCGVAGVTDVITFDLSEGGGVELDADLLVCVEEARRQASARGWGVEREVLLYALHGTLHCLGHDDRDEASSERMHAREDEILAAIGVGRTYGGGPAVGGAGSDEA